MQDYFKSKQPQYEQIMAANSYIFKVEEHAKEIIAVIEEFVQTASA